MKLTLRQQKILEIIKNSKGISISEIKNFLQLDISQVTINRDLAELVKNNFVQKTGKGRAIRYNVSASFQLFAPFNADKYFADEIDLRNGEKQFNVEIFRILADTEIFTDSEKEILNRLQKKYVRNIKNISPTIYKKELERLTIDLSWKSSQIEGNTYSLLETEQLLKQQIEAKNKTKEEAIMLLNHKEALRYITKDTKELIKPLKISVIEDIHSILIKNLGVEKNIRKRLVRITGTTYTPPDNEFQIREYLQEMCNLINSTDNDFEKALLAVVFVSYIQPFADGNKRSGRIIGNALLTASENCPLSYRSVSPIEYKKSMLLFYEQNNMRYFKELFIKQYEFAVNNYFS